MRLTALACLLLTYATPSFATDFEELTLNFEQFGVVTHTTITADRLRVTRSHGDATLTAEQSVSPAVLAELATLLSSVHERGDRTLPRDDSELHTTLSVAFSDQEHLHVDAPWRSYTLGAARREVVIAAHRAAVRALRVSLDARYVDFLVEESERALTELALSLPPEGARQWPSLRTIAASPEWQTATSHGAVLGLLRADGGDLTRTVASTLRDARKRAHDRYVELAKPLRIRNRLFVPLPHQGAVEEEAVQLRLLLERMADGGFADVQTQGSPLRVRSSAAWGEPLTSVHNRSRLFVWRTQRGKGGLWMHVSFRPADSTGPIEGKAEGYVHRGYVILDVDPADFQSTPGILGALDD